VNTNSLPTDLPPDSRQRSNSRQRLSLRAKRWLLLLATLSGCFLVLEIALRILGLGVPPTSMYRFDPHTGARLVANYSGWQTREGRTLVTTNDRGLRDVPHAMTKPAETFRIAVIGDSFAEAAQVEIEETFWKIAESELQRCQFAGDQKIEVLNFGVSGFGTAQELLMLRHYVWQYEPDMILLSFFPDNDIQNNSPILEPEKQRPFFSVQDNRLVLDDSRLADPEREQFERSMWIRGKDFAIRHIRLLGLAYQAKQRLGQRAAAADSGDAASGDVATEAGLNAEVFAPPTGAWETAWELTDRLIETIAEEATAHQASFAVLVVTSGIRVDPDPRPAAQLATELGVDDLGYADRRLLELGQRNGFPVIVLTAAMRRYAQQHDQPLHGFENAVLGRGHWNRHGHALAGKLLAEALCETPPQ